MDTLSELSEQLQNGKVSKVRELVQRALDEGIPPRQIIDGGLLAGMGVLADRYRSSQVFVPQVLVAARAANAGLEILKPHMRDETANPVGRVVIGTVEGDLHDIGKNMVKIMLQSKGLEVIDLGVDVSPERFFNAVVESGAELLCCSALLTTTIESLQRVIVYFREHGYRDKVYIMIGGAPVTQELCDHIGADCYTYEALDAAEAAYDYCMRKKNGGKAPEGA
ncbi:MAG: corrinoid protein [Oscillospiraceae bacterium]|nr:corrinoid protein [Oscillospiraceae bacterium]